MKYSVDEDLKNLTDIASQDSISLANSQEILNIIKRYFRGHNRNQSFMKIKSILSGRFGDILENFNFNDGTIFSTEYFLFCFTLTDPQVDFRTVNNGLYSQVAVPFKNWVEAKVPFYEELMNTIEEGNDYVFIVRQAHVTGYYAPGKSIYTYAEALLSRGNNVWVIALYGKDDEFLSLTQKYPKLRVSLLFEDTLEVRLNSVIEILKLAKPKVILTEIEFDLPSILAIMNKKIPMLYLSQGYYNLPFYDLIGYLDADHRRVNLGEKHKGRQELDFFDLPVWVSKDILAPKYDRSTVNVAKKELGLTQNDFVIGSFGQMGKFTKPFLNFLKKILSKELSVKVLLAGPGDNSFVLSQLQEFIAQNRALVLPAVNVNIVGHCLDIGLDTFPLYGGYSVLELMAKDIPVLSLKGDDFSRVEGDRLPETVMPTDTELLQLISDLIHEYDALSDLKSKTNNFMISHDKSELFIEALEKGVNIAQNKILHQQLKMQIDSMKIEIGNHKLI